MVTEITINIDLPRTSNGQYLEMIRWCGENFADNTWGKTVLDYKTMQFHFRDEKDAMLFALRWAGQ